MMHELKVLTLEWKNHKKKNAGTNVVNREFGEPLETYKQIRTIEENHKEKEQLNKQANITSNRDPLKPLSMADEQKLYHKNRSHSESLDDLI